MGFMDYQAPQKTDFSVINNALDSIYQQKQDEKKNKLLDMQMQREQNALDKEAKGKEYAGKVANAKDEDERTAILKEWGTYDPQGMNNTLQAYNALDAKGQADMKRKAETLYNHISGVLNQDGTLNTEAYNAKAPQYGLPQVDGVNVTSQSVMGELNQAKRTVLGLGKYIEMQENNTEYNKREDRRENFEIKKVGMQNANSLALHDKTIQGQKEIHQMDINANNALLDKKIDAGIYGGKDKANGFDIAAYRAAVKTLSDPYASDEDKEDARLTAKSLKSKYSTIEDNETPTSTQTSGQSWKNYLSK